MTKNRAGKLGKMATSGFQAPQSKRERTKAEEKRQQEANQELYVVRCVICRGARPGSSYPIHSSCCTRRANDGIVTLRPYLYQFREGALDG